MQAQTTCSPSWAPCPTCCRCCRSAVSWSWPSECWSTHTEAAYSTLLLTWWTWSSACRCDKHIRWHRWLHKCLLMSYTITVMLILKISTFSCMINKSSRSIMYGWMTFKRTLLQLWMLLLWRSWTRWVRCMWKLLIKTNFIKYSVFRWLYMCFLWTTGFQLEGGRLRSGNRTLHAPLQSRSFQNTVEGYWQHLAKLWQNLGGQHWIPLPIWFMPASVT